MATGFWSFISEFSSALSSLFPLGAIALISFLFGLAAAILMNFGKLYSKVGWRNVGVLSLLMLGVGVLGAAAGLAGGQSRTGVVGEIIPAAFVLLGGMSAYLFGVTPDRAPIVALTTISFSIALFAGFHSGSSKRLYAEEQMALRTACLSAMTNGVFVAQVTAYDRFWNAMQVKRHFMKAETVNGPQFLFETSAHLCTDAVRGWTLQDDFYSWSTPKKTG